MSFFAVIFTPLVLLLPAANSVDEKPELAGDAGSIPFELTAAEAIEPPVRAAMPLAQDRQIAGSRNGLPFRLIAESFRVPPVQQVRIEQRMTIRVVPRPSPVRPNIVMDMPNREVGSRFAERKMGKCLPVSGIAGVQPEGGHRLILFMHDQRIVSAELERACRARDFYSGFYLSRSSDGKLCVDRDTLLSRSGVNCKLTRIRQLVEIGD